jgi:hypothetical protein
MNDLQVRLLYYYYYYYYYYPNTSFWFSCKHCHSILFSWDRAFGLALTMTHWLLKMMVAAQEATGWDTDHGLFRIVNAWEGNYSDGYLLAFLPPPGCLLTLEKLKNSTSGFIISFNQKRGHFRKLGCHNQSWWALRGVCFAAADG